MSPESCDATGVLVEAEAFADYGGWVLIRSSSWRWARRISSRRTRRPVADASTAVQIDDPGRYRVWVRAKDWVPSHHPGRFTLAINGTGLETESARTAATGHGDQLARSTCPAARPRAQPA